MLGPELNAAALGLYALLFLALWLSWTTFMLYGNVAAGQTRVLRLMAGMFGLGVMAASVPGVAHTVLGHGSDLLLIVVLSGSRTLQRVQSYLTAPERARRRPRSGGRPDGPAPVIHGVSVDPAHLSERLGLFVIIVLGESVVQVVSAAGETRYDLGLLATAIASFILLAGMFGLSVVFGYAGLPHLRAGRIPTRAALGLHCLVTAVVATVAVSLSPVVRHGSDPLPDQGRWHGRYRQLTPPLHMSFSGKAIQE